MLWKFLMVKILRIEETCVRRSNFQSNSRRECCFCGVEERSNSIPKFQCFIRARPERLQNIALKNGTHDCDKPEILLDKIYEVE